MLFYYRLSTYSKKLQRKSCKHGRIHTCFQGSKLCIQYALTIQTNTRFPIRKAVSFACQIHTIFCKLKFIYSEKATKFCEISTLDLTVCSTVKYKVEISQNFVAFSEYMNFSCTNKIASKPQNSVIAPLMAHTRARHWGTWVV